MAVTKLVLITTSFLFVGSNAYNKVGVERFCNIDPEDFSAQCNYESLASCQSYLISDQRCIVNADYSPTANEMARARSAGLSLWTLYIRHLWTDLIGRLRTRFTTP